MQGGDWLNDKEIRARCDVSQATLYLWRKQGKGPPWFRIGGRILYDKTEFEKWLESQRGSKS